MIVVVKLWATTIRHGGITEFEFAASEAKAAQERVLSAIQVSTGRSLGLADVELRNMAENRLMAQFLASNRLAEAQFIESVRQARNGDYMQLLQFMAQLQQLAAGGYA